MKWNLDPSLGWYLRKKNLTAAEYNAIVVVTAALIFVIEVRLARSENDHVDLWANLNNFFLPNSKSFVRKTLRLSDIMG